MTDPTWVAVCRYDDLEAEQGVAVLVHGRGVAIFRTLDGEVHAVSNRDPLNRAGVLARGLVGHQGGATCVALPEHLQSFDLVTGVCLSDPHVRVPTYEVRVTAGPERMVEVGPRRPA